MDTTLLRLAKGQFDNLTAAEKKLLNAIPTGEIADCSSSDKKLNDPLLASTWPEDRTIRSSILRWVCTNKEALALVHSLGIRVTHARFIGELNLAAITASFSLELQHCAIPEGISINDASLRNLDLSSTVCGYLMGWDLNLTGSLLLRYQFRCHGPVFLAGASIRGDLECVQGHFGEPTTSPLPVPKISPPENVVLYADRITVGRRVVMVGMQAQGIVQFVEATINGGFDCREVEATIGFILHDMQARSVNFNGAQCPYLIADRLQVKGSLFLRENLTKHSKKDFKSVGAVVLRNSSVSGDVNCQGASFGSAKPDEKVRSLVEKHTGNLPLAALTMNGSTIGGYVNLSDGFCAHGGVNLNGVTIALNLICYRGRFYNAGKDALTCQFAQIKGAALFRERSATMPFETDGYVNLFGATVAGSVSFRGAKFIDAEVETKPAEAAGKKTGTENEKPGNGVRLQNAKIAGQLEWTDVTLTQRTEIILSQLKIGQLEDDETSWPASGKLTLDGFSYDAIAGVPLDSRKRKEWLESHLEYLKRQAKDEFSLQPHRQLADTLRKSGYEDNARDVLIEMHKARREQGGFSKFGWVWSWILQGTIGFGYRSYRTFIWGFAFVVLGAFLFNAGYQAGFLVPPRPDTKVVSQFSAIGYSLDSFLPIINLHQEELWVPSGFDGGRWLQIYYWIHICLGWALITLGVAGFTGLIRRE